MAGVKGRSGGARPGSGRKRKTGATAPPSKPGKKGSKPSVAHVGTRMERMPHGGMLRRNVAAPPVEVNVLDYPDMLTLLTDIALGKIAVTPNQLKAAIAAIPYTNQRVTPVEEKGKKEQREGKAKEVASSPRFAPMMAPVDMTKMQ